jgi:hypothetical protein
VLRPVKGGLQKGFVFDDEIMQIGGVALFDGAKLDFLDTGIFLKTWCLNCRVVPTLTRPTNASRQAGSHRHNPIGLTHYPVVNVDVYPALAGNTDTARFH